MSIASEITRLQGVKSDILTAISNKGVTVPTGSALDDCPDLIASIETEGPDLSGYTIYDYFVKTSSVSTRVDMTPATSGFAANFEKFLMSSYDNTDYKIHMKMKLTGTLDSEILDSSKAGLQHNFRFYPNSSYFVIELPCTSSSNPYVLLTNYIDFSSDIELTIGNDGVAYNGTTYPFSRIGNKATTGIDYLYLRGQWNDYNGSTFYYYEIEYKGKVVNRLVPAKRKSDSNLGWLDEKTGEFYVQNGWQTPPNPAIIPLPAGYSALEYTQIPSYGSGAGLKIDFGSGFRSGFNAMADLEISMKFNMDSFDDGAFIFSAFTTTSSYCFVGGSMYNGIYVPEFKDTNSNYIRMAGVDITSFVGEDVELKITKDTMHWNGNSMSISNSGYNISQLAAGTVSMVGNRAMPMKLYSFDVKYNGSYICLARPAVRNSDGVEGLIDIVTGDFFTYSHN